MERGGDRYIQRMRESVTGNDFADTQERFPNTAAENPEFSFGRGPSYIQPGAPGFNDNGQGSFGYELPRPHPSTTIPGRVSLPPRNSYAQQSEPRGISNAQNHFGFVQNLYNAPLGQASPRPSNFEYRSPMSQLVNNMILQRPMQLPRANSTGSDTFYEGPQSNRLQQLQQLQPPRQQATPPFNLSTFTSPRLLNNAQSSSPPAQASSPTIRISQRRAVNHTPTTSTFHLEHGTAGNVIFPVTPKTQTSAQLAMHDQQFLPTEQPADVNNKPNRPLANDRQVLSLGNGPPMAHGIQLVSPQELPDRFRQIFRYELFNAAQSKCFAPIYKSNYNVVVSAPTGSGKTALLELAICKLVENHPSEQFKVVYTAPTKSLCSERAQDWQKKFSHLNMACAELTGDTSQAEMAKVGKASIIVTTPEKFDSVTRKWKDHIRLLQLVKLFLIDEVHILKDPRGATLEAVVSRMKSIGTNIRFVALSATVPNSQDIAAWLGKDPTNSHLPAHRETFSEDFRPVKLQKHVYGYEGNANEWAFEKILDGKLPSLIAKYSCKKPIMVFCFTRKSCEATAAILADWWTRQRPSDRAWPAPMNRTPVSSKEMQELAACGVAFHHAGLDISDRHAIETSYLKGDISLICCTSTLAVGVNLPCHLVVLKGTVCYQDNAITEFSDLEIMQMLGRAGRPQFDNSAVAVIMTRLDKADRYKKMISGQDVLESTLHLNLIEHLNSEIGLGTVHDVSTAKQWLAGTFLSVRISQNPTYYKLEGVPPGRNADERLELVCERDIKLLQKASLITEEDRFRCTEYGEAMSRYMVQFDTMKLLMSIPQHAKTEQILQILCQATEFKDLRMKPTERSVLREFNKSPFIKYPVKENISITPHKISIMIQVQLGGVDMPADKDFRIISRQYLMETKLILERIQRLIRCVIDCKLVDCDSVSTRYALDLARSLSAGYWENSSVQLRQIPQVGPVMVRKLAGHNINSIEKFASLDIPNIERVMGRYPPFGKKMQETLSSFPQLTLSVEMVGKPIYKSGHPPAVKVRAQLGFANAKVPNWGGRFPAVAFMAESTDGVLVHFWRGSIKKLDKGEEQKFTVKLSSSVVMIRCFLACDDIVGTLRSSVLTPDIPASAFPLPREKDDKIKTAISPSQNIGDDEEFGEDIEDEDMLAVVKGVEVAACNYDSDDFVDIDELDGGELITGEVSEDLKPKKMANGKWMCNHHCRNGQLLKTGQPCKHMCCKEGLDKPRKIYKKKPSAQTNRDGEMSTHIEAVASKSKPVNAKLTKKFPGPKLGNQSYNSEDIEIVDLEKELPPVPYGDFAPREYGKLHDLHTSIQSDNPLRLPKKKPSFSYASGQVPSLPSLSRDNTWMRDSPDPFDSDADLPSPSVLLNAASSARKADVSSENQFEMMDTQQKHTTLPSFPENSLQNLEQGMTDFDNVELPKQASPKLASSFANDVFDFAAFNSDDAAQFSSPLMIENRKRVLPDSPVPRVTELKRVRVNNDTPVDFSDEHHRVDAAAEQKSLPSWVHEFDQGLIEELKGFVDFVD